MTWGGTARLLGVLACLLAFLWLAERRPGPPVEQPLLGTPPEHAGRIELDEPAARLTAVREASGWVDPAGRPWRSDAPDDLLRALTTLRPTTLDAAGEDAVDEYGLGTPAMRLRVLDGTGNALLALEIGRRNPAWTGRYARRSDVPAVLLVGALLDWELDKLRQSSPTP